MPQSSSLRAALEAAREGASAPPAQLPDASSGPDLGGGSASQAPLRLRLAIDDVGDWSVHIGGTILLGQAGAGRAHVGLHAPVAAVHASLRAASSFHGGEGWDLVPAPGEEVLLDGVPLDGPAALGDGARVALGPDLCLTVRRPDPASASLLLCAERDEVLGGAGGVLAWFPGPGGRIRLGPDRQALLGLAGAEEDLLLEASDGGILLVRGAAPAAGEPAGGAGADEPTEAWIPLPLEEVREVRLRLRGDAAATSLCFLPPAGPGSGGG
ncbi:MAG: hypothetical protein ISQ08_11230 [Planctomycetes bacterium]|nr:hypothetical protein [Planctomycetota bacterium]